MEKLTEAQIEKHLETIEGWDYYDDAIHTTFEFENFMDCFSVMTRIAMEAEKWSIIQTGIIPMLL